MFEESLKTPADRAREPETLSPEKRAAWRAAGVILVCNVLLGVGIAFARGGQGHGFAWIVALVLAYKLYHLRAGTDTIVLVLAAVGLVFGTILYVIHMPPLDASLISVSNVAFVGALLLLLLGEPSRRRRIAATVVYFGLTLPIAALEIIASLSMRA